MGLRLRIAPTLAAIALAFLAFASLASASTPDPATIEIVSPAEIDISADEADSEDIVIRNSGDSPIVVSFELDGESVPKVEPEGAEVFGRSVRIVTLYFTPEEEGKESSGVLIASGENTAPAAIPFSSSAEQGTPWWVYAILLGSLAVAVFLIVARWLIGKYPRKATLTGRIGPANWDFTKSWGSTLTAVGALLGTILSASVLPDTTSVPKATYAGLNLFFGALILIAPFVYTATQTAVPFHKTTSVEEPQYQGYVWSFLLATAITLWAALGELGTILAVFEEIRVGQTMPDVATGILAVLLGISAGLLLAMSWKRTRTIVEFQSDTKKQRERHLELHPQQLAGLVAEPAPGATVVEPELPSWSVL